MFTCDMTHCDDMQEFEVEFATDMLNVCSECADDWRHDDSVLRVARFAGLR